MKNGGHAFPMVRRGCDGRSDATEYDGNEGMTLRDYFATHAPTSIPIWFTHVEPSKDNLPAMPDHLQLDEVHQKIARDWEEDPVYDLPEELTWYGEKVFAYRHAWALWRDENSAARFFQWRWHYADGMLAERTQERKA